MLCNRASPGQIIHTHRTATSSHSGLVWRFWRCGGPSSPLRRRAIVVPLPSLSCMCVCFFLSLHDHPWKIRNNFSSKALTSDSSAFNTSLGKYSAKVLPTQTVTWNSTVPAFAWRSQQNARRAGLLPERPNCQCHYADSASRIPVRRWGFLVCHRSKPTVHNMIETFLQ